MTRSCNRARHLRRNLLSFCLAISATVAGPTLAASADLDTSFAQSGRSFIFPSPTGAQAFAGALQPDGKLILGGWAGDPASPQFSVNRQFALFRQFSDGSYDPSFGTSNNGIATLDLYGGNDAIVDMAYTPQGIYVVGYAYQYGTRYHVLARYTHAGALDPAFGTNGLVHMLNGANDAINALAIQPDGRIVIAGRIQDASGNGDFLIARFNANGTHDTTFGTNGLAQYSMNSNQDVVHDLVVQPNGRILVVGDILNNGVRAAVVLGLEPSGIRDFSFGTNGSALITRNSTELYGRRIALSSEGHVLVGSLARELPSYNNGIHVARLSANGVVDTTFNNGGNFQTFNVAGERTLGAIEALPDGKVMVAGGFPITGTNVASRTFVARYGTSGALDAGFNGSGFKLDDVASVSPTETSAQFISVAPDGKFYVGGYSGDPNIAPSNFFVLRYQGTPLDLTPNNVDLTTIYEVARNSLMTSESFLVNGLSTGVRVPITVENGSYTINGAPATSLPGFVGNGDSITVSHISASTYETPKTTVVRIGGNSPSHNRSNITGLRMVTSFSSYTWAGPGGPPNGGEP